MAFTNAQKVQIRKWLGYPTLFRLEDVRLESAITVVGNDPDAQAEAEVILAKLNTGATSVETQLEDALGTAGLKRAEDIEWYQPGAGSSAASSGATAQQASLEHQGRILCSRLSQLFGVPLYGDAYGTRGYPGDEFTGKAHQYGGGVFRMG